MLSPLYHNKQAMKIQGDTAVLNLNVLGKSNPDSTNEWDSKWVNVDVKLKLDGFTADFQTQLLTDDFITFDSALEKMLDEYKGESTLNTMEESIYLKGTMDYSGKVLWEGFVMHPVGNGNKLNFTFESDYNQLVVLRDELQSELSFS